MAHLKEIMDYLYQKNNFSKRAIINPPYPILKDIEEVLINENNFLIKKEVPQELLLSPTLKNVQKTEELITSFLHKQGVTPSKILTEDLKKATQERLIPFIIEVLNDIGVPTFDLRSLDLQYNLSSIEKIKVAASNTPKDAKIGVDLSGGVYGFAEITIKEFLKDSKAQLGYFQIHLAVVSKSESDSCVRHRVTGFVNKTNHTITIYDGAEWIDFDNGIEALEKYMQQLLPSYQLEVYSKCHQFYGTCAIFQPTVVYMMLLYRNHHLIMNYLDQLSGVQCESVMANMVMSLINYRNGPKTIANLPKQVQDNLVKLFYAVEEGNNVEIKRLLVSKANPNHVRKRANNEPLLHIAILKKNLQSLNLLLLAGADPECYNNYDFLPMHYAVTQGLSEMVELLLIAGANPTKSKNFVSDSLRQVAPLTLAIENNDLTTTRVLLAQADPDWVDNPAGATPLYIASSRGHVEIVKELLQANASIDKKRTYDDATPLYIAAKEGRTEVVKILLDAGAYYDYNCMDKDGPTPLWGAFSQNHEEAMELLLSKGASPHVLNKEKLSLLFYAAKKNDYDLALLLIDFGARVNQQLLDGLTPLFIAAQKGFFEIAELLIRYKAQQNPYETTLESLRVFAKQNKVENQVEQFISFKKASHTILVTPKDVAIIMGHKAIADLLRNCEPKPSFFKDASFNSIEFEDENNNELSEPKMTL